MSSLACAHTNPPDIAVMNAPILVVEDNQVSRIFLERSLRKAGFENVVAVESGTQAIEQLDIIKPELVILDVVMPGMDGFACCDAIRKQSGAQLPVLMQTVMTEPEMRVKAFSMGAADFISKPVFPDELCARVLVHLQKSLSMKQLAAYKARIENELSAARQLQLSILPQAHDMQAMQRFGHLDMAAVFEPSSEIGGDFWGMKTLSYHQQALWLTDFSGHGVASALNSFRLQAHLNEYSTIMTRPGEYMSYLGDKLRHMLARGQFATMFYGIIDSNEDTLSYACASAPHPIILRQGLCRSEILDGSGVPLGVDMQMYHAQETAFAAGDVLCLYSDALTETVDASGNFISELEIASWLESAPLHTEAERIKQHMLDSFYRRVGCAVEDDLTLLIIKRN